MENLYAFAELLAELDDDPLLVEPDDDPAALITTTFTVPQILFAEQIFTEDIPELTPVRVRTLPVRLALNIEPEFEDNE